MFTEFFIVVTVTSENFQRYGHGHRRGGYLQHCRPVKSKNPHMCHLSFNSWHSLTEYILNYFLFFKLLSILSISIVRKFDPNLELYNGIKAKMQTVAALEALATKEKQHYSTYEYFPIYSYNEHDIS